MDAKISFHRARDGKCLGNWENDILGMLGKVLGKSWESLGKVLGKSL